MSDPPDRDPQLQREIDRAAHELARRLRPVTALADPHGFATRFVEDLHAEGWWPHPRPEPVRRRPGTPPSDEFRAAAARLRGEAADHSGEAAS